MLYVKPYEWREEERKDGYYILVFGHTPDTSKGRKFEPCLLRIRYHPWLYVELPNEDLDGTFLLAYLKEKMFRGSIMYHEIVHRKNMSHYNAPPKRLLKILFNKKVSMNTCGKHLGKKVNGITYNVYEKSIDPIVKYQAERDLLYSEWLSCKEYSEVEDKISTCSHEYNVKHNMLSTVYDVVLRKQLGQPLPKICSFDFEMASISSINGRAMPKAHYLDDVIHVWGMTFFDPETGTNDRYCICLADPGQLSNAKAIVVETEEEALKIMCNLIMEHDPDVFLGHNIFKFDLPYLDIRMTFPNCAYPQMSRLIGFQSIIFDKEWESSAYNEVKITYPICPGRIWADTLLIIRRNYKLQRYDLNTVSKEFLKKSKHDVDPIEITESWRQNVFIKEYESGNTSILEKIDKRIQQLQDLRNLHEFEELSDIVQIWLYGGTVEQKWPLFKKRVQDLLRKVAEYCVQDTCLPPELFMELHLWYVLVEDSNVRRVSILDLYTRGQDHGVFAQEYYELFKMGYVVIPRKAKKYGKYEGAHVYDGKKGITIYDICMDFAKLYPSIIMAYNMCYTTFVQSDDPIPDQDCYVIEWDDSKTGEHYRFRWVKEHILKGAIPSLLEKLSKERDETKELLKHETSGILKVVYGSREKALKVSANSVYGTKGSHMSKIGIIELAMCTTFIGRRSIISCSDTMAKKYGIQTIYGDTDSNIVHIPGIEENVEMINDIGYALAEELSSMFKRPMKLEYEKAFRVFIFLGKKMYLGLLLDKKNPTAIITDDKHLFYRGVPLARRDNCELLIRTYKQVALMCLSFAHWSDVIAYVERQIRLLYAGYFNFDDFVIVKKMGKDYKSASNPLAMFQSRMKDMGEILQPGDRVDYVFIEVDDKDAKQGDRMLLPKFFDPSKHKLDMTYYLLHMMAKPLNKLISSVYPNIPKNYIEKSICPFMMKRSRFMDTLKKTLSTRASAP